MSSEETRKTSQQPKALRAAMGEAGRLVRPMAVLAWLAVVTAKGLWPATRLLGDQFDWLIQGTSVAAGTFSHLLSLSSAAFAIGVLTLLVRDKKISALVRMLLVMQTAWVLLISVPATRFALNTVWCFLLGVDVAALALVAGLYSMKTPRTRAAGFLLTLTGFAALLRLPGVTALALASPSDGVAMSKFATWLSTLSFVIFGTALLVATAWIAVKKRKVMSAATVLAMAVALAGTWVARAAEAHTGSTVTMFIGRLVDGLTIPPVSIFSHTADEFVALFALLLAVAALTRRKQIAAVSGTFALVLTAGIGVDIPARAFILLVASLSAVLATRDDQGMWEALLGKRLESSDSTSDDQTPSDDDENAPTPQAAE